MVKRIIILDKWSRNFVKSNLIAVSILFNHLFLKYGLVDFTTSQGFFLHKLKLILG